MCFFSETLKWSQMKDEKKKGFVLYLLDKLEVVDVEERRNAARSILYLCQGQLTFSVFFKFNYSSKMF